MKNRIKLNTPTIKSRAALEDVLGQIRSLTIARNQTQLQLEAEKTRLDEKYGERITEDQKQIEALTESVRVWVEANDSEFGGLKSAEFTHATIGWRTGQPTLKTLTGWTWDRVLEKIKFLGGRWSGYIRQKEEINKQALINDRELLSPQDFRDVGLRINQEESFFIEPNIEELENRQTTEAIA